MDDDAACEGDRDDGWTTTDDANTVGDGDGSADAVVAADTTELAPTSEELPTAALDGPVDAEAEVSEDPGLTTDALAGNEDDDASVATVEVGCGRLDWDEACADAD